MRKAPTDPCVLCPALVQQPGKQPDWHPGVGSVRWPVTVTGNASPEQKQDHPPSHESIQVTQADTTVSIRTRAFIKVSQTRWRPDVPTDRVPNAAPSSPRLRQALRKLSLMALWRHLIKAN